MKLLTKNPKSKLKVLQSYAVDVKTWVTALKTSASKYKDGLDTDLKALSLKITKSVNVLQQLIVDPERVNKENRAKIALAVDQIDSDYKETKTWAAKFGLNKRKRQD